MKYTLTFIAILCGFSVVLAQTVPDVKPARRFKHFKESRMPSGESLPQDVRSRAIDQTKAMMNAGKFAEAPLADQPEWRQIGPFSTGGRVKSIIVHPTAPGTLYIGAAAGGVWKTTDDGANWTPLMDDANGIAMGSLCFDPANPDIIYAGTGEQVTNANIFLGAGIMKTTNGGETWTVLGLTDVGSFSRVYAHPMVPGLIMASAMNTNSGVYRSADYGLTWKQVLSGQVYDMSMNPADPNEYFVALPDSGIHYTSNGGTTWERRMNGISGTIGRISVQQAPTNPDWIYVLAEHNGVAAVFTSMDRGRTFVVSFNADACFFSGSCQAESSQGFYDNYISISPHDHKVAFAGGIDIWRTTSGGTHWSNLTNGYNDGNGANLVHVDQHCAAWAWDNPNKVYAGNDGGMVISTNNGTSWKLINNNLAITQFYGFDVDVTDRNRVFGGTQDNGTLGIHTAMRWDTIVGGDGMVTLVDPTDPMIVFGNQPNGRIFMIDFRSRTVRYTMNGINTSESAHWVAPLAFDPTDPSILYAGRRRVYATVTRADVWYPSSPTMNSNITAITASAALEGIVWAGTQTGELIVSTDFAYRWKEVSRLGLINRHISSIATSSKDPNTAWVTYSSYGTPNLVKTTDLGNTWTSLWQGMPDVPANSVAIHPSNEEIIFVGTDIGVFASFNGGRSWMPYGKGLTRSPVLELRVNPLHGLLLAATHGRSIWEVPIINEQPSEPTIAAPAGGEVYTGTLMTVLGWTGFTPPVQVEFSVDDGVTWKVVVSETNGSAIHWKVVNYPTVNGRIRVTSKTKPDETRVSRPFTISPINRGSILSSGSTAHVPYGIAWDGANGLWSTSFYERKLYRINATTLQPEKEIQMLGAAGDSLFTDITMDRKKGTLYIHRMNSTSGGGGVVIEMDTNGRVLKSFPSAAPVYPTGLVLVNDELWASDRDGQQRLYVMNPNTGELIRTHENPRRVNYGPRSLATDERGNVFQVSTNFPSPGRPLSDCYIIHSKSTNASVEFDRMPLSNRSGFINARGVEFDQRDETFWISDFGGNIYKVTSFSFVPPDITSVADKQGAVWQSNQIRIAPNPAIGSALISCDASGLDRRVELIITDQLGRRIATLYSGRQPAADALAVRWFTHDVASGVYMVHLIVDDNRVASKNIIVRH